MALTRLRSHKDWRATQAASLRMEEIIKTPEDPIFQSVFEHVLEGGGWRTATACEKPWAVLVTGLNGIRKTSASRWHRRGSSMLHHLWSL